MINAFLLLIGFTLIMWGLDGAQWLWLLGLAFTAAAHVFALLIHWAPEQKDEDDNNSQQGTKSDE